MTRPPATLPTPAMPLFRPFLFASRVAFPPNRRNVRAARQRLATLRAMATEERYQPKHLAGVEAPDRAARAAPDRPNRGETP